MRKNLGIALSFGLVALAVGCAEVDTDGQRDEFVDRAEAFYPEVSDSDDAGSDLCVTDPTAVLESSYLFGIETPLNKGVPIMLFLTLTPDGDGYDLSFQPLAKDDCPGGVGCNSNEARAPVGDPIVLEDVAVDSDGILTVSLVGVAVDSAANAGTGTAINADINLEIAVCSSNFLCGGGELIVNSLGGAELLGNIGAVATEDPSKASVEIAPLSCDEEGNF